MSIKVNTLDPCSKNVAPLLHAIADYLNTVNQKVSVQIDVDFKKEKDT